VPSPPVPALPSCPCPSLVPPFGRTPRTQVNLLIGENVLHCVQESKSNFQLSHHLEEKRKVMSTCTSCGSDVTGKKFCQQCGTPVQPTGVPTASGQPATPSSFCTNCGHQGTPGERFCSNCGSPMG